MEEFSRLVWQTSGLDKVGRRYRLGMINWARLVFAG